MRYLEDVEAVTEVVVVVRVVVPLHLVHEPPKRLAWNEFKESLVLERELRKLDELIVTDTIPLSVPAKECGRIRQLSVAALLAETIRRIRDEESVSSLYVD